MSNNSLPHSAISSWGGFLYQGKVALFHSLKLIVDGNFDGKVIDTFELQLDSTDDFAMALLHKDLKCKAPLIEPNLRRNLGKWST
ncbi:hypothetical protein F4T96_13345 [Acinetobacter nosocomialis]|nr:hypothetical protein [Acinetobacter nosocomialis]